MTISLAVLIEHSSPAIEKLQTDWDVSITISVGNLILIELPETNLFVIVNVMV